MTIFSIMRPLTTLSKYQNEKTYMNWCFLRKLYRCEEKMRYVSEASHWLNIKCILLRYMEDLLNFKMRDIPFRWHWIKSLCFEWGRLCPERPWPFEQSIPLAKQDKQNPNALSLSHLWDPKYLRPWATFGIMKLLKELYFATNEAEKALSSAVHNDPVVVLHRTDRLQVQCAVQDLAYLLLGKQVWIFCFLCPDPIHSPPPTEGRKAEKGTNTLLLCTPPCPASYTSPPHCCPNKTTLANLTSTLAHRDKKINSCFQFNTPPPHFLSTWIMAWRTNRNLSENNLPNCVK